MNIETAIKQTKAFEDSREKAMVNILFTSGWLNQHLKDFFRPYNLTAKQYNILRILNGAERSLSVSDIRERVLDKMSDITRISDRMKQKGLLEKGLNSKDKRLVEIKISQKGSELLKRIKTEKKFPMDIIGKISSEDAAELSRLLDKFRNQANDHRH